MKVRYHKIKNIFWGIQDADKESGKNLGWIKATKGPSGKMGECYLAHIKAGQWPHPGNRIVKKGILTNVKSFNSLKEAKQFVEDYYNKEDAA